MFVSVQAVTLTLGRATPGRCAHILRQAPAAANRLPVRWPTGAGIATIGRRTLCHRNRRRPTARPIAIKGMPAAAAVAAARQASPGMCVPGWGIVGPRGLHGPGGGGGGGGGPDSDGGGDGPAAGSLQALTMIPASE